VTHLFSEEQPIRRETVHLQTESLPQYVPGEVLVKFKKGISSRRAMSIHGVMGAKSVKEALPDIYQVQISSPVTVEQAVQQYEQNPDVEYAEPNYIYYASGFTLPNDADFGKLWGMHNTGQTVKNTAGTVDNDIDAPEAWYITRGEQNSIIVADLDTGVLMTHPDLSAHVLSTGYDFVNDDTDPTDDHHHGTHVGGTIGAIMDNSIGVAGVNPNAKILPIKVLSAAGSGTVATISGGIDWAVSHGAKIINASLGGAGFSQTNYDSINNAKNAGVLFVAAAGNEGTDNTTAHKYPSDYELSNIISVAATGQSDTLASFSNYGSTIVHVAAPGVKIYSTSIYNTLYNKDFDTDTLGEVPSGWVKTGTNSSWAVSAVTLNELNTLTDSPGAAYLNNTNSVVYYDSLITSSNSNKKYLTFSASIDVETNFDFFDVVYSTDNKATWLLVNAYTGTGVTDATVELTTLFATHTSLYLGFRLRSDGSNTASGVFIDDVVYKELAAGYEFLDGTSMATPHVAGLASLIWSYAPTLTYTQVKDIILNSVEKKASLTGKVSTGGRINAYNALKLTPGITVEKGNIEVRAGDQGYVEPEAGKNAAIRFRPSGSGKVEFNIYTLSGSLVYTTTLDSVGTAQQTVTWDGRTNAGELVASGIYLIHITGPGIDERKKIAVIK